MAKRKAPPPGMVRLNTIGGVRVTHVTNGGFSYKFQGKPPYTVEESVAARLLKVAPGLFEIVKESK